MHTVKKFYKKEEKNKAVQSRLIGIVLCISLEKPIISVLLGKWEISLTIYCKMSKNVLKCTIYVNKKRKKKKRNALYKAKTLKT